MEKKLKIALIALIVIALTLISFVGIYTKKSNVYKNIIKDYLFSSNLKGSRVVELGVDTSTKKVKYDENGNVVEDTENSDGNVTENENSENNENDENTENSENTEETKYTTVDEPINPQEKLVEENYKTVKKIIQKRLETLNVSDYKVKLNKSNGKMIIEIPEDSMADEVVSYLDSIGSFELTDSEDNTLLLDNNDIKKVQVAYNTDTNGTTVYITIGFNKDGKKKLEEISNKYTMVTDENDNTIKKEVTIKMEGEKVLSTYFSEPITNGEIQLTVGSASTDAKTVQEYLKNAAGVAMLLNSGKMPIKYTVETSRYIKPVINDTILTTSICVLLALVIISFVYLIYKYKKLGALTIIGSIFAIDLLLLAIRYTNVYLSIESAVGIIVLILFNIYIMKNILKEINNNKEDINKSIKKGLLNSIDMIVIMLIISIVFTFITWSSISNVGILIFWGIICILISHLLITRTLLLIDSKE